MTANCANLMSTAIHLLESDAAFALRIQTSEPVLVGIARSSNDGVVSRASIALHRERERSDGLQTEACASVLGPYIFEQYTEPNPNQVQRSARRQHTSHDSASQLKPAHVRTRHRTPARQRQTAPDSACQPSAQPDRSLTSLISHDQVQRSRRDGASSTESTVEFDPRERDHSDSGLSVPDTFAMVCAPYSLDEDPPEPPEPPEPRRAAKVT